MNLEGRFKALLASLGPFIDASFLQKWWKLVSESYGEGQSRHYHTLQHLSNMFELLDKVQAGLNDERRYQILALSIFFHDVVYDPRRKDNELRSNDVFRQFAAEARLEGHVSDRVCLYIEATILHAIPEHASEDGDLRMFLDFDLAILGMSSEMYDMYVLQIRQEYSHIADEAYLAGRAAVLRAFLARETLFFGQEMQEAYEEQARMNIKGEIKVLEGKIPIIG
jgi:predicted metal-dependent HD superfamily phosphohydrolase